jgi:prepilin-type N-terminal cleavage/methylation domain-containing protein
MFSATSKTLLPSRCRGERGMTLIEILIALAIMAIAVIAFLAGLTTALRGVTVSDRSVTMEGLAKGELEYVKSAVYTAAPWEYQLPDDPPEWDLDHALPAGYTGYSAQVNACQMADFDPSYAPEDKVQQITVVITHVDTGGRVTSIAVTGLKAVRE